MTNITESALFNQLMDDPGSAAEVLRKHGIVTRVAPLGTHLAGMVYRSTNGTFYIIANQILEFEERRFVFFHELAHIIIDAPQSPYILQLDWTKAEKVADQAAATAYKIAARKDGFF